MRERGRLQPDLNITPSHISRRSTNPSEGHFEVADPKIQPNVDLGPIRRPDRPGEHPSVPTKFDSDIAFEKTLNNASPYNKPHHRFGRYHDKLENREFMSREAISGRAKQFAKKVAIGTFLHWVVQQHLVVPLVGLLVGCKVQLLIQK